MKVWRVSYHCEVNGSSRAWCSSKRNAESARAEIRRRGEQVFGVEPVEVPTTKQKLIEWLNVHARLE